MKYLKIFESFDSKAISQTIKYLNDKSKNTFLDILKKLVKYHNLPIDKISDNYLKYSRISKIDEDMVINNDEVDIDSIFFLFDHNQNITGSFVNSKNSLNALYLWYVKNNTNHLKNLKIDTNKGILKPISKSINYLEQLKSGDLVYGFLCDSIDNNRFEGKSHPNFGPSIVYIDDNQIYLIQNFRKGSSPDSGIDERFGSGSWCIYSSGNLRDNHLLCKYIPNEDPISVDGVIEYSYNPNILYGSIDLNKSSFYIKFDFNRFKKDFGTITSKLQKRAEYKLKDEEISIEDRLFNRLIKKSKLKDLSSDDLKGDELFIGDMKSLIINKIGYKYSIFHLYNGCQSDFSSLSYLDLYTNILKSIKDSERVEIDFYLKRLKKDYISNLNKINRYKNSINNIRTSKENIKKIEDESTRIGQLLVDKINKMEIETLSDVEIINDKLKVLSFYIKRKIEYDSISPFINHYSNITDEQIENFINEIKLVENYINKKF